MDTLSEYSVSTFRPERRKMVVKPGRISGHTEKQEELRQTWGDQDTKDLLAALSPEWKQELVQGPVRRKLCHLRQSIVNVFRRAYARMQLKHKKFEEVFNPQETEQFIQCECEPTNRRVRGGICQSCRERFAPENSLNDNQQCEK